MWRVDFNDNLMQRCKLEKVLEGRGLLTLTLLRPKIGFSMAMWRFPLRLDGIAAHYTKTLISTHLILLMPLR